MAVQPGVAALLEQPARDRPLLGLLTPRQREDGRSQGMAAQLDGDGVRDRADRLVGDEDDTAGAVRHVPGDVVDRAAGDANQVWLLGSHPDGVEQGRGDVLGDLLRAAPVGALVQLCLRVRGGAHTAQVAQRRLWRAAEQGASAGVVADATGELGVGRVEADDGGALSQDVGHARLHDEAAPGGDDDRRRRGERGLHGLAFLGAKARLPQGAERLRDGQPETALHLRVEVDALAAEPLREQRRDGGLAAPGQAHEDDVAGAAHRSRPSVSLYPCRLRVSSSTESPPHFSSRASARTMASIASATTAPAGTTQMSLRS